MFRNPRATVAASRHEWLAKRFVTVTALVLVGMTIYGVLTFSTYPLFIAMLVGGNETLTSIAMTVPAAVLILAMSAWLTGPPARVERETVPYVEPGVPLID